jgi:hypothetical protein
MHTYVCVCLCMTVCTSEHWCMCIAIHSNGKVVQPIPDSCSVCQKNKSHWSHWQDSCARVDWLIISIRWDCVLELWPPAGLLFITQVLCEHGEPWWWWRQPGKTPDSSTRALWQSYQQSHLVKSVRNGRRSENFVYLYLKYLKGSITCHQILRYGDSGFASHSNEGVLWNFIALKNPSPWPGLNPRPLGPVASTLAITPQRQCVQVTTWCNLHGLLVVSTVCMFIMPIELYWIVTIDKYFNMVLLDLSISLYKMITNYPTYITCVVKKLKLSHYKPWRRLGERRYSSYSISTSAVDGGEWSVSRPGHTLAPGRGPPVSIVQEAEWAPEPVWTQRLEEKSCRYCQGSYLDHLVVQSVAKQLV